jgi:hypothetical protein
LTDLAILSDDRHPLPDRNVEEDVVDRLRVLEDLLKINLLIRFRLGSGNFTSLKKQLGITKILLKNYIGDRNTLSSIVFTFKVFS